MTHGKKVKWLVLAIASSVCVSLMTACTTYDNFKKAIIEKGGTDEKTTITIGVFEPLTGDRKEIGREQVKGIELANSIYNSVKGYKIELMVVDTKTDVNTSVTAIRNIIDAKPVAIIGSAGESTSLSASEYINKAKIPCITPSATNPLITKKGGYYFRASITESQMGAGLADYAVEKNKAKNIGIISASGDTETDVILKNFTKKIDKIKDEEDKISIYDNRISVDDKEVQKAFSKIIKGNVDVCFAALGTEGMDKLFSLAEKKHKTNIVFLGNQSCGNEEFIEMMKNHPDIKIVFPYNSIIHAGRESNQKVTQETDIFRTEYEKRYGSEEIPSSDAALGFDSYLIMINAINHSRDLTGSNIKEALYQTESISGSTGVFSFDEQGNVLRPVNLATIRGSSVVSEYVTKNVEKSENIK